MKIGICRGKLIVVDVENEDENIKLISGELVEPEYTFNINGTPYRKTRIKNGSVFTIIAYGDGYYVVKTSAGITIFRERDILDSVGCEVCYTTDNLKVGDEIFMELTGDLLDYTVVDIMTESILTLTRGGGRHVFHIDISDSDGFLKPETGIENSITEEDEEMVRGGLRKVEDDVKIYRGSKDVDNTESKNEVEELNEEINKMDYDGDTISHDTDIKESSGNICIDISILSDDELITIAPIISRVGGVSSLITELEYRSETMNPIDIINLFNECNMVIPDYFKIKLFDELFQKDDKYSIEQMDPDFIPTEFNCIKDIKLTNDKEFRKNLYLKNINIKNLKKRKKK